MKIIILTHGDTDGICAGALAYAANQGAQIIFTNPYRLLEDLNKIKEPSKIIICDLSLQENKSKQILSKFKDIIEKGNLTYIDHHPLPINISIEDIPGTIIHNPLNSTSELIFSFYQSKLESMHARTAIYGAIADNLDNTPLIQTLLKKYDKRTLYMETGILFQGVESLGANEESKKRILHNLASNIPPSQDEELVKSAIQYTRNEWDALDQLKHWTKIEGKVAYTLNFPFSLGKTASYLCGNKDIIVGIAGEKRGDNIDLSIRTSDEDIDLNMLLRKITIELGGSGGGHPSAAGARIPERNFIELIKILNANIKKV